MNKKKILYFDLQIPYLLSGISQPIGGAAVEWLTWLRAFNNIGCNAALLTWKGSKQIFNTKVEFDIIESFQLNKGIPKIKSFTYELPSLLFAIKKYNPDFIVQEGANRFTGLLAFISVLLNKKFIHRIASDMDVDGRIDFYYSKYNQMLYYYGIKNASHIVCQNNYQLNILKKKYPQKNISLIYNPFQVKIVSPIKVPKKYIAWVGNFRKVKNLQALAQIAKSLPQFNFKIAGTKFQTVDEETSKSLIILESLENVDFVGHLKNENIPQFLSKAYCLLNTSRLEGFSNTFLEAWSVGVPVITTQNVNPDKLISKYNLGVVSESYKLLPDIIKDVISTKKYLEFKDRCKKYVLDNHNPEYLAIKFLNYMTKSN